MPLPVTINGIATITPQITLQTPEKAILMLVLIEPACEAM